MTPDTSILAWKILWTDEPSGVQFYGATKSQAQLSTHAQAHARAHTHTHTHTHTHAHTHTFQRNN